MAASKTTAFIVSAWRGGREVRGQARRGFTLVELLVVITIIGLLTRRNIQ